MSKKAKLEDIIDLLGAGIDSGLVDIDYSDEDDDDEYQDDIGCAEEEIEGRRIYINGEFGEDNQDIMNAVRYIIHFNSKDKGKPVEERMPIILYITSSGGDINSGFQLIDAISTSVTPVYTVNLGYQYSMALLVGIVGDKRFAMPNAKYLIHDGSLEIAGTFSKVREHIDLSKYPFAINPEEVSSDLTATATKLAQSNKGEGHDQWLTGPTVQFDLCFTNKAWVEAERYRFLYFISSQSTMHRMVKFDLDLSYSDYTDKRMIEIMKSKVDEYNSLVSQGADKELIDKAYLGLIYSNPAGFKITARMCASYRQLKTIYSQRRNHRLPEWRSFCAWIETLPFSELITGAKDEGN